MKAKEAGKDEVIKEMLDWKGVELMINWVWKLCYGVYESGVGPEDWRTVLPSYCTMVKGREKNLRTTWILVY